MKKNPAHAKLTTTLITELAEETDEHLALRRALLHCVLLLEEAKDPAARSFVDHLLLKFAPLATAFTDEKHPYIAEFEIIRGRLPNKRLNVFLPLERVTAWLSQS